MNVIVDLDVIVGNSADIQPKSGFQKINVDLNAGARGKYIYLCYQSEEQNSSTNYISDLKVISGDTRNIKAPDGYEKIDVDLNMDADGKYIYLCSKRKAGDPITVVNFICTTDPSIKDQWPTPYIVCKDDLNEGAGGKYIYLYYKKG